MKTDELREKYLAFFETKGHTRCDSDVLVPTWDPSVLFTPAGMNQFKDHFLGKVKLDFTRATSCQKCLRAGDIDNVGRTPRHHTFFEMLGNFSFGDYFKRDAIHWAWEFLTDKKWLGISPDRLSVTVYKDDPEAADIWKDEIGLDGKRIEWLDEDENFWPASAPSEGPDGVCGPCSEIYYHAPGLEPVEIWNLVFTQFNREGDPPNNLMPLPSKNIDTGMGLERAAAALQGVETNYHIDSLKPIVDAAAEVCGAKYSYDSEDGRRLRRIADHVRACTFCVHENVYPGANKEKYVVKRLLRRAVLDGHQMGLREPFLHKIVPAVVDAMKVAYPDLVETTQRVQSVIDGEEVTFFSTIDAGLARIDHVFDSMKSNNKTSVDGAVAADLYQTHGVPPELFESLAQEKKLGFDWDGYRKAMDDHGDISGGKKMTVMGSAGPLDELKEAGVTTEFLGYEATEAVATVKGLVVSAGADSDQRAVEEVSGGAKTICIVLDRTPFYGESGGQVGDTGELVAKGFRFEVTDTQKDGVLFLHLGKVIEGAIRVGAEVTASVAPRRQAIARAHSATHILHHALSKTLGSHAQQQGSKVDEDWLRFDFTNLAAVTSEQLAVIEKDVHTLVAAKETIDWKTLPLADARAAGAMMLFGEKYPDPVRMVSMGNFSKELCGGTHLTNTDQVGDFEILSEEGVSSGTRRVTAVTGAKATEQRNNTVAALEAAAKMMGVELDQVPAAAQSFTDRLRGLKKKLAGGGSTGKAEQTLAASKGPADAYESKRSLLKETAQLLNTPMFDVPTRLAAIAQECESIETQLADREQAGGISAENLLADAKVIAGTTVVIAELPMAGPDLMRQLVDQIRKTTEPSAILFASKAGENKVTLIAAVSRDLVAKKISAGNWVKEVAPVVGGGGGGKPDMAQAGGKDPSKTPEALEKAEQWITTALG